jgi:hypothetical protein
LSKRFRKGVEIVNMSFPIKVSRVIAVLYLLAFLSAFAGQAAAASPDPRMYGPWAVVDAENQANIGLRAYFSPDGNFFMVDPRTQLGFVGSWVVGRAGLLVSIYGNGQWAKLWDADVSFDGDDHMIVDVKDSQFAEPQRVVLQRIRF